MRRGLAVGLALALAAAAARAQAPSEPLPSPRWAPVPPGSTDYFGSPLDDTFTPNTLFPPNSTILPPPKPTAPPAEPAPASPLPSGAGDGLFPDKPPPPPPKIWRGSADIGLNGASGNTNVFSGRTNWHVERKTDRNLFITDFQYNYLRQDGNTDQQQAILNTRDEIPFVGKPWSLFSAGQIEYDELRDYRFRVGQYAGVGYLVADATHCLFRVRAGAGANRELGVDGAENQWVPEAVFGYDLRYRFDERNALASVLDYYPRIDKLAGQFRVRARVAYEVIIDPDKGTVVRVGVQDRYDSNPGNSFRNDLTYFVTFGLKF